VGEKKSVSFTLSGDQLSVIDDDNQRVILPGKIQVFVGGKQPDNENLEKMKVLSATVEIKGEANIIDRLD
jgi:beta-glucosidase